MLTPEDIVSYTKREFTPYSAMSPTEKDDHLTSIIKVYGDQREREAIKNFCDELKKRVDDKRNDITAVS